MRTMSDLDYEIHEMAGGDMLLRMSLTDEIIDHIEGTKSFSELSDKAQIVVERWETGATSEINGVEPECRDDDDTTQEWEE